MTITWADVTDYFIEDESIESLLRRLTDDNMDSILTSWDKFRITGDTDYLAVDPIDMDCPDYPDMTHVYFYTRVDVDEDDTRTDEEIMESVGVGGCGGEYRVDKEDRRYGYVTVRSTYWRWYETNGFIGRPWDMMVEEGLDSDHGWDWEYDE